MRPIHGIFPIVFLIFMAACRPDDNSVSIQIRDRAEQYAKDIDTIQSYLKSHQMIVDVQGNVQMISITDPQSQVSVWDQQDFPLQHVIVKNDVWMNSLVSGRIDDSVDYKLYYLVLNQGLGDRPSLVDDVMLTYKGWRLDNQVFDFNETPIWFEMQGVVSGFRQIVAKINASTGIIDNGDGTTTFENYGNVIVFIPSGLGYFNSAPASIGAYNPIIFQIKLKRVFYRDHDNDGILSKDEIYGNTTHPRLQDTDGDNIPDFLDVDDDGDRILTRVEISDSEGNIIPFDLIPDCNGNTTNPDRLKKHLDPTCN